MSPEILLSQAKYEEDNGNYKQASDLYVQAGHSKHAIEMFGKRGMLDQMMEICKNLEKHSNQSEIELCAKYFR